MPSEEPACFPAAATVVTPARGVVRMDALRVGESVVADAAGAASPVYLFTHADDVAAAPFVRLTTVNGSALTASSGHYLLVRPAGAVGAGWQLTAAAAVAAGDILAKAGGGGESVASTAVVTARGLYNPHTLAGTIVVDGFVTSTHTTAVAPALAAAALAPVRAAFRWGGTGAVLAGGWPALTAALPSGPAVVA